MIGPGEIKNQALKWWKPLLQSTISGEAFFPKTIDRIGRVQTGHITGRFEALQAEIELLYRHSKNRTGIGYLVKTAERNFRRTGSHELPENVTIESIEDYLHVTGRKKEWTQFVTNYSQIIQSIPQLQDWAFLNVSLLTKADTNWESILTVCKYFLKVPRPNLYLRQLPLEIHTKFIEENSSLLQSMLDFLLPEHIRNTKERKFAERYYMKHDEPLIRIRFLDERFLSPNQIADISIRLSDFQKEGLPGSNVLITENKMNFLALPSLHSTLAIWSGGGFNLSYLRNVLSLQCKNIYYWGDIDEHGFQLLHQIRSYYPQTLSIMMDMQTFETFRQFVVDGQKNKSENLHLLTESENNLYQYLKSIEKNRLEQEKIQQSYADKVLRAKIGCS